MTREITITFETESGLAEGALKHVLKRAVEHAAVDGTITVKIHDTDD